MKTFKTFIAGLIVATILVLQTPLTLAESVSGLTVDRYELVSSKRVGRTTFEYTFTASVSNTSQSPFEVSAQLTLNKPGVTIVDGDLQFGLVEAGNSVVSSDTFTIQLDRTVALDASDLTWDIQATELRILDSTAYPGKDYGFTAYLPADFDILEVFVDVPALLSNKTLISRDHPNIGIGVYDNKDQEPIRDWYERVLAGKEYTTDDTGLRKYSEVMIDGVPSLQIKSEFWGDRVIRTYIPNGKVVIGVETSVPDFSEIHEVYFSILDSLKINKTI